MKSFLLSHIPFVFLSLSALFFIACFPISLSLYLILSFLRLFVIHTGSGARPSLLSNGYRG
jgi:hypothetical protein